jgi:UDP-N-acetylglucosamine transferase subunit ALG13
VIFATVGTHQDGFPRMLRALEELRGEELVVQYGYGQPPANAAVAEPFFPFPQMAEHFAAADVVVTHAGVGSILLAIRHGHVPIVIPRLQRNGEHLDDHQVELAERMAAQGRVEVVWDTADLASAVARTPRRGAPEVLPVTGLHAAVRAAIRGEADSSAHAPVEQDPAVDLGDPLGARRGPDGLARRLGHRRPQRAVG